MSVRLPVIVAEARTKQARQMRGPALAFAPMMEAAPMKVDRVWTGARLATHEEVATIFLSADKVIDF